MAGSNTDHLKMREFVWVGKVANVSTQEIIDPVDTACGNAESTAGDWPGHNFSGDKQRMGRALQRHPLSACAATTDARRIGASLDEGRGEAGFSINPRHKSGS